MSSDQDKPKPSASDSQDEISEPSTMTDIKNKRPESSPIDIKHVQDAILLKNANTLSSMMMAHRIALEDDFKLEPGLDMSGPLMSLSPIMGSSPIHGTSPRTEISLQNKVKDIVHDAYWDLFREEVDTHNNPNQDERKYDLSKQLLSEIRQKIIDLLLPQHEKLKQNIVDTMDQKIIEQMSNIKSLHIEDYSKYILGIISKLCAPVRDVNIETLSKTSDLVARFRGIMELLELMRLDLANFTLTRFRPHIKAHSQEYERDKFNEILKNQQSIGIDGLEFARIWLCRAVQRVDESHGLLDLINEASRSDAQEDLNSSIMTSVPETSSKPADKSLSLADKISKSDIVNKVLNSAFLELLEWSPDLQKLYPETLLFDEASFKILGDQTSNLIWASSILLTSFAFIKNFNIPDDQEFKNSIKSNIVTLLCSNYENDSAPPDNHQKLASQSADSHNEIDRVRLEVISARLCCDFKKKLVELSRSSQLEAFESQSDMFSRQILDLQSSSNRVKELARRRILEFLDTILTLDAKHRQNKISGTPPPVNIPLGLNCLTDEITLVTAQLVRIVRYNRQVFMNHYQDIIVDAVVKRCQSA